MDQRSYFFVYLDGEGWAFIAMTGSDDFRRTVPLQEWKSSSGTFYMFARICYTMDQAKKEMEKSPDIMVGPDMYTIWNMNKKKRIATIWHPRHLPFVVYVDMNVPEKDHGGNSLLDATCTFDDIRGAMSQMLGETLEVQENDSKEKTLQFWHVVNTK